MTWLQVFTIAGSIIGIIGGLLYLTNKRIDDLRTDTNKRIDEISKQIDEIKSDVKNILAILTNTKQKTGTVDR